MANEYLYEAFGLILQSEYPIAQLPTAEAHMQPDVVIRQADLSAYGVAAEHYRLREQEFIASISNVGTFRITDGALIEADPAEACELSNLGVYLMGTCMGAVLHQRGYMPLHGSCVTNGSHAILITGDSGAGKSTLAAEFLRQGWYLLTDDVCAVSDPEHVPTVHASYPSQKLWQDSLAHYERPESDVHSLYVSEEREKFGVDVSRYFFKGTAPLSMVIRLLPTTEPCSISPVEVFTALDQMMENTYRAYMIAPAYRQRHFQRCADLAVKIPVLLLTRQIGVQCAEQLYQLILERLS